MSAGNMGPEEVVTVQPNDDVADAVATLESENVGSVVVEENDEPVGILTDRDVALATTDDQPVAEREVTELMTEDPATIREDEPAMEISRTIDETNARRLPIVDENGELTGMVTLDDLVATIGEQLDNVSETIEAQSPGYSP